MSIIPLLLEQKIHQVITQKLCLKDFEGWVYTYDFLEKEYPQLYFDLISFDYNKESSFKEFEHNFGKYIGFHKFEVERIKDILMTIINRDINCGHAIWMTYELYDSSGYPFFEKLGLQSGLCFAGESGCFSIEKSHQIIDMFYPFILTDAKNALSWFENNKIIFKDKKIEYGEGFEYEDYRNEAEIKQGDLPDAHIHRLN